MRVIKGFFSFVTSILSFIVSLFSASISLVEFLIRLAIAVAIIGGIICVVYVTLINPQANSFPGSI